MCNDPSQGDRYNPLYTNRATSTSIHSKYLFKAAAAMIDTGPLYVAVYYLRPYLHLNRGSSVFDAVGGNDAQK